MKRKLHCHEKLWSNDEEDEEEILDDLCYYLMFSSVEDMMYVLDVALARLCWDLKSCKDASFYWKTKMYWTLEELEYLLHVARKCWKHREPKISRCEWQAAVFFCFLSHIIVDVSVTTRYVAESMFMLEKSNRVSETSVDLAFKCGNELLLSKFQSSLGLQLQQM